MQSGNIILMTDSYKQTHHSQYPPDTESVYSYFEARKGATYPVTVFFGLQYLLMEYLEGVVVTKEKIDFAESLVAAHLGNPDFFDRSRWDYIVEKHGGRLPLAIKAVPEGMPVPIDNVMMTVHETDSKCYWLTNHVESLLTHIWSPSTVATLSRDAKTKLRKMLLATGSADGLDFMLHDFGYRGVSSNETAAHSGAGHLVNFKGTDTLPAIELLMKYYDSGVCAFSVPATEHSVMTSLGQEGEERMLKHILDQHPAGILSIVIDSYDHNKFIELAGTKFKDQILARDGKVVFRPDSGYPIAVTKKVLAGLATHFGFERNSKGFNVLNPKVGALWGDGINVDGMMDILMAIADEKWAAQNMVFGMGGGLLQKINRDTQRFAFKCSHQRRGGMSFDIFKQPIDVSKTSKKGRMKLVCTRDDGLDTMPLCDSRPDVMKTVFENGEVVRRYTLDNVRINAAI